MAETAEKSEAMLAVYDLCRNIEGLLSVLEEKKESADLENAQAETGPREETNGENNVDELQEALADLETACVEAKAIEELKNDKVVAEIVTFCEKAKSRITEQQYVDRLRMMLEYLKRYSTAEEGPFIERMVKLLQEFAEMDMSEKMKMIKRVTNFCDKIDRLDTSLELNDIAGEISHQMMLLEESIEEEPFSKRKTIPDDAVPTFVAENKRLEELKKFKGAPESERIVWEKSAA